VYSRYSSTVTPMWCQKLTRLSSLGEGGGGEGVRGETKEVCFFSWHQNTFTTLPNLITIDTDSTIGQIIPNIVLATFCQWIFDVAFTWKRVNPSRIPSNLIGLMKPQHRWLLSLKTGHTCHMTDCFNSLDPFSILVWCRQCNLLFSRQR
jgi:hypothetical protein